MLTKGQVEEIAHTDIVQNNIWKVYVMFSVPLAGLKTMNNYKPSRQATLLGKDWKKKWKWNLFMIG